MKKKSVKRKESRKVIDREVSAKLHLYLRMKDGESEEQAEERLKEIIETLEDHHEGLSSQIYEFDYNEY